MRSEAEIKLLTGVAVESWVIYVFQQWQHVANHYSHNSYLNTIHITTTWISWQEFNSARYCRSKKRSGSQRLTVISKQTVTIYIIHNIII